MRGSLSPHHFFLVNTEAQRPVIVLESISEPLHRATLDKAFPFESILLIKQSHLSRRLGSAEVVVKVQRRAREASQASVCWFDACRRACACARQRVVCRWMRAPGDPAAVKIELRRPGEAVAVHHRYRSCCCCPCWGGGREHLVFNPHGWLVCNTQMRSFNVTVLQK